MSSLASVEKAIDLLFHLHESGGSRGVSELGRALGLPKSSAHRLLRALTRRGLVEQEVGGRYRPGVGLLALGVGVLDREPLVAVARAVLEEEARALAETVFLTAPRGGSLVVLDKAEGPGFLRAAPRVGAEVPLHATAVGKLALAFAPERFAVDREPERFTDRTRVAAEALAAATERARLLCWAENRGEWIEGLAVVAAPILRDAPGAPARFEGALAVAAPEARMRRLGAEHVARRTLAAARRIGARLSGRPEERT